MMSDIKITSDGVGEMVLVDIVHRSVSNDLSVLIRSDRNNFEMRFIIPCHMGVHGPWYADKIRAFADILEKMSSA